MKGYSRGPTKTRVPIPERSHLVRYRVIQRDLVYVIGIPQDIATEEILSRYEYFGQYGPIKKIVVNSQNLHNAPFQRPTVSAYVTFYNIEDAQECIYSLESFAIQNHTLKASFGTSKYCATFLSGAKCTNPECMYLHYIGEDADSFGIEEISINSQRFQEMTRPPRPKDYDMYSFKDDIDTIFPFRRITKEEHSYEEDFEVEIVEKDSKFLKELNQIDILKIPPLKVQYNVDKSIMDIFQLNSTSFRSLFEKNSKF